MLDQIVRMSQNNDSEEVEHDSYMSTISRPDCDSCQRSKEDGETGCLDLGDGRELCSDCSSIAITDTNSDQCNSIIQSVFEFYKTQELKVDEKIPIFFMDKIQMRRFTGSRDICGMFLPSMWDYFKMLSTSALPVKLGDIFDIFFMHRMPMGEKYLRSGGDIKKVGKLPLGRAIVLSSGSPDIVMGRILAHEMMHASLSLQGIPYRWCEDICEEGLCEVMAHDWLQWFPFSGFDNPHKTDQQVQHTKELKEFLVENMRCRTRKVYSQGFIDARGAIEAIGFKPTLDHVKKYGILPQPIVDSIYSTATFTTTALIIQSKGYEVKVRQFIGGIQAIGTIGYKLNLDHVIKNRTLPQTMMDSTSAAHDTAELIRKNISATPQRDQVICKASSNTIKSFWKPTVATTIDFIWKTATTTSRIIVMKGDLLLIGFGLLFEHR